MGADVSGPVIRRLTTEGRFTVLAIDHGSVLRHQFEADGADSTSSGIEQAKLAVVSSLAPRCSAVLADLGLVQHPEFVRAMNKTSFGLLVSVDEADYDNVLQPPPAVPEIDMVRQAKKAGASALKVVVYYDRDAADADVRLERISAISQLSRYVGLPLLVEPLPGQPEAESAWPVDLVARDMAAAGASIVKVPLPDVSGAGVLNLAKRITNILGPVPWIVLSSGSAFPLFLEKLRNAMAGGASGFAAGRSLWDNLITRPSDEEAKSDALDRLDRAIEVTTGSAPTLRSNGTGE